MLKHHYPLVSALESHILLQYCSVSWGTLVSCVTIWGTSLLEICCCAACCKVFQKPSKFLKPTIFASKKPILSYSTTWNSSVARDTVLNIPRIKSPSIPDVYGRPLCDKGCSYMEYFGQKRSIPREGFLQLFILAITDEHVASIRFQIICSFYLHMGRSSNLTNIFQKGWNHQLGKHSWITLQYKTPPSWMRQTMLFPTLSRVLEKLRRYLIIRGSIALVSGASKQIIGPGELLGLQKGTLSQLSEHHWDSSGQFITTFPAGWSP